MSLTQAAAVVSAAGAASIAAGGLIVSGTVPVSVFIVGWFLAAVVSARVLARRGVV